eukprot:764027-Hanusia_phi.AAC.3
MHQSQQHVVLNSQETKIQGGKISCSPQVHRMAGLTLSMHDEVWSEMLWNAASKSCLSMSTIPRSPALLVTMLLPPFIAGLSQMEIAGWGRGRRKKRGAGSRSSNRGSEAGGG